MNRLKWLAGMSLVGDLDDSNIGDLIVGFSNNGVTAEKLATHSELPNVTRMIVQILGYESDVEARRVATAISQYMQDQLVTELSPPSTAELDAYIQQKRIRTQNKDTMRRIYQTLVSEDSMVMFTMDPTADGNPFNPIWLRLALERVFGFKSTD